ncbi:MAG: hypothetical protein V3W41_18435 [Planctomycetota bacterium]
MPSSRKTAYAGIFLLAGSMILFQIALTRVFAILMWHHFTYMVVSIAMLGFGAAGSILTARRDSLRTDDPRGSIAFYSWAYGLTLILSFFFATLVKIDTLRIWEDKSNILGLMLFYLIIAVPMLLGGLAIGQVLTRMPKFVDRLYFSDLLGSALGGAASAFLLSTLGNTNTVIVAGGIGTLAGFVFALGRWRSMLLATLPLCIGIVTVIGFLGGSSTLHIPKLDWEIPFAPGKDIEDLGPGVGIAMRIPSSTAEVQVSDEVEFAPPMIGGNIYAYAAPVAARYVAQDGTAPTMLYRDAASIEKFPFLKQSQAGSAYVTFDARGGKDAEVLVIGVGGGVDVMVALANGAKHVTAVEINKAMIRMVQEDFADYTGNLFTPGAHQYSDRIELINREGRSYMRHRDKKYDVINMAGVDSFTALSTGAYTLSESYLYTVEAVQEFYEHLKPEGYVNYSRFILNYPQRPRETLRLANIAWVALKDLGIDAPEKQILVFQGDDWASTMIKKGPFTQTEVDALQVFGEKYGFRGFLFNPTLGQGEGFSPPAKGMNLARREFEKIVGPTIATPLGIELDKKLASELLSDLFIKKFEGRSSEAGAALDQFALSIPETKRDDAKAKLDALANRAVALSRNINAQFERTQQDFAALMHGSEKERAEFLADYPFQLSACTDDTPFFFNYYRSEDSFGNLFGQPSEESSNKKRYHPDVPVGHRVLQASLAQIALLAFILILLPILRLRKEGVPTPGKFRYLAYFGSLGVGFMFIEIVLMQKLVIFLGHPTYAISVVLTSLLGFAGIGSFLSGRTARLNYGRLMKLMFGILISLAFALLALNWLVPLLLGWPLWSRILVTVAIIAPLGTMLGMPFPTGIRILEQNCPQLLPWGWAINGFMSVLASILCIVLSQEIGFTKVLMIAGAVYAFGFLLMKGATRPKPPAAAEDLGSNPTA